MNRAAYGPGRPRFNFSKSIISSHSLELGQQEFFHIRRHRDATYNVWPKDDWRCSNEFICECDNLKIVVEVFATATILRVTCDAWKAFTVMADAADIAPAIISKENIGAKVHALSETLKLATSAC